MSTEHERPTAGAATWSPQALLAETIAGHRAGLRRRPRGRARRCTRG